MAVSVEFKENVATKNYTTIRSALCNYLVIDPTCRTFDECLQYAQEQLPDIIVAHDGEEFTESQDSWDKDYFALQQIHLLDNFSLERIALLRRMSGVLFPSKTATPHIDKETCGNHRPRTGTFEVSPDKHRTGEQVMYETQIPPKDQKTPPLALGGALLVGGAAAIVAGTAIEVPAVVVAGVASAAAGGYVCYKHSRK